MRLQQRPVAAGGDPLAAVFLQGSVYRDQGRDSQDTGYSYSNSDLSRPDWRMMLWRVPRIRGSWSGTGTVMVVPSVCNCMIR